MMNEDAAAEAVITKVELQKRNKHRYNIYIDEEYAFSVHEDVLIKHRLLKGEPITAERMQAVVQDEERSDAYMKAIRFLGTRPRTEKEVQTKLLSAGYEHPIIEETLRRLSEQSYIDDRQFAKLWTEHRIQSQRKGKAYIRQELLQKGVDREHVQKALQDIDPDDELSSALEIGSKKWRQTSGQPIERQRKTMAFLLRRGFSPDVVQQAVRKLNEINNS
jgi:regulatory protein